MESNKLIFYDYVTKIWDTTIYVIPEILQKANIEELRDPENKLFKLEDKLAFGPLPEWLELPVVYRCVSGFRYRDDISYGIWTHLISDRLYELLMINNVTGWKSYPIRLYSKDGVPVEGYHGFIVSGRGGFYDNYEEYRNYRKRVKGIYNIKNWDGSDFFRLNNTYIAVTEKVYDIIKTNKLKAFDLSPLDVTLIDSDVIK